MEEPSGTGTLEERLVAVEERLAFLEIRAPLAPSPRVGDAGAGRDVFWALEGLRERVEGAGGVLFTGTVALPGAGRYDWQRGAGAEDLLAEDWSAQVASLSALAHPVRLLLLREVLHGTDTTAALANLESLGTTGQLHHHLRQLVAAGWLRGTARGRYAVPPDRVVPLLVILLAARR